eukprot:3186464-Amphidinium_carterae.1
MPPIYCGSFRSDLLKEDSLVDYCACGASGEDGCHHLPDVLSQCFLSPFLEGLDTEQGLDFIQGSRSFPARDGDPFETIMHRHTQFHGHLLCHCEGPQQQLDDLALL